MSLREYLSDRLGQLALWGVGAGGALLFLPAVGAQRDAAVLLVLALTLLFAAVQTAGYLRCRGRLEELASILEGLDRKYLFAECLPPPRNSAERRLFALLRRSGKSMIETVSEAQSAQREYREYVERWIHEIKTPITAAGLISRNAEPETRRKLTRELAQIEAHVERALFYARAESPEKDFMIRQTTLADLTTQAIGRHRALLTQCGVRVETENLEQTVYTDEKWAVFILGQLLQNAARYRNAAPAISISARSSGKQIRLSVRDNGTGIPAHELPRVFERGFTGSNGRARGTAGSSTGMGLYLCRKLADHLEIDLRIASEEGHGTTVTLTFPTKENLTEL